MRHSASHHGVGGVEHNHTKVESLSITEQPAMVDVVVSNAAPFVCDCVALMQTNEHNS